MSEAERSARRRRIEELQREIDQARIAEATVALDQARLDACQLRLDEAEAHIADALTVLGGIKDGTVAANAAGLRRVLTLLRKAMPE